MREQQDYFPILRNGNRLNALHAYFVILGRDPTATELSGLETQLAGGTPFGTS